MRHFEPLPEAGFAVVHETHAEHASRHLIISGRKVRVKIYGPKDGGMWGLVREAYLNRDEIVAHFEVDRVYIARADFGFDPSASEPVKIN